MKTDLRAILQNNGLPRAAFAREMETRRLLAQMVITFILLHLSDIFINDIFRPLVSQLFTA